MPHTAPDWSWRKSTTIFEPHRGDAELAARLGSPHIFNREGDVIYLDDFENGFGGWDYVPSGLGATRFLTTDCILRGSYAAVLRPGTTPDKYIQISKRFQYPVLGNMGVEFSVVLSNELTYIYVRLVRYDGVDSHTFHLEYNYKDRQLKIFDGALGFVVIKDALTLAPEYRLFHTFKLVCDLERDEFIRAIVDEVEYNLSTYVSTAALDGTVPRVDMVIHTHRELGLLGAAVVDRVIFTQNER